MLPVVKYTMVKAAKTEGSPRLANNLDTSKWYSEISRCRTAYYTTSINITISKCYCNYVLLYYLYV